MLIKFPLRQREIIRKKLRQKHNPCVITVSVRLRDLEIKVSVGSPARSFRVSPRGPPPTLSSSELRSCEQRAHSESFLIIRGEIRPRRQHKQTAINRAGAGIKHCLMYCDLIKKKISQERLELNGCVHPQSGSFVSCNNKRGGESVQVSLKSACLKKTKGAFHPRHSLTCLFLSSSDELELNYEAKAADCALT